MLQHSPIYHAADNRGPSRVYVAVSLGLHGWRTNMTDIAIEDCRPGDSFDQAARDLADALGQAEYFAYDAEWHLEKRTLIAVASGRLVGFLRFAIQEIGADCDRPSLTLRGKPMREAYVLAFGVAEDHRRRGVGTALQNELIRESHNPRLLSGALAECR